MGEGERKRSWGWALPSSGLTCLFLISLWRLIIQIKLLLWPYFLKSVYCYLHKSKSQFYSIIIELGFTRVNLERLFRKFWWFLANYYLFGWLQRICGGRLQRMCWAGYSKMKLTQPNIVELELCLSLAITPYCFLLQFFVSFLSIRNISWQLCKY